jgi:hypothetical protein
MHADARSRRGHMPTSRDALLSHTRFVPSHSMNRDRPPLRCAPPSHLKDSRSDWWEVAKAVPHHGRRDLACAIWRAYRSSSLPRFSEPERFVQAGLWYPRRSKMQDYVLTTPVHARYRPAWSGTRWHRRSCWYAEQAWWNTDRRAG